VINVLQEFVVRKLTPSASKSDSTHAHPAKGL